MTRTHCITHGAYLRAKLSQSCLTLCNLMGYSPPGSSVHGILQARILEWVAISFSSESSRPRDRTWVFHIVASFCTVWATREALVVKNPPAFQWERQEMQVRSLGWEDPLEKETETHSSILPWRIPTDRGAWWAIAHKVAKSQT